VLSAKIIAYSFTNCVYPNTVMVLNLEVWFAVTSKITGCTE